MAKALVYARISSDPSGEGLGVERQLQDCRKLAQRLGVTIVGEYVDNDVSATSGAPRPQYQAMLAAIRRGEADMVIAWNLDRLYRRMRDLEDYIELVECHHIRTETCIAGSFDLNTPMGRAIARNAIAFAQLEVDQMKLRIKNAKLQGARMGQPNGGPRPFGYEHGGMALNHVEAEQYRRMALMAIDGMSWNRIAQIMNTEGSRTSRGREWRSVSVQKTLTSKRYVGIRTHNGTEYQAQWPAILTMEEWTKLEAAAKVRGALYKQRGTFRVNLLLGFVYCGECGARLIPGRKCQRDGSLDPAWTCLRYRSNEPDGCGRVSRLAAPMDDLVADAIIFRINSPEVRQAMKEQQDDSTLSSLILAEQAQEALLAELLVDRASGLLTRAEYATAKEIADAKLATIRATLASHANHAVTSIPSTLTREEWDAASLEWRRSLIAVLIDKIVVHRSKDRKWVAYKQWKQFNPDLIEIQWRA